MSATWRSHSAMSAFGGKADITRTRLDVRFWPKADIRPPVYVHCTSIALTHKIHTLSTLQSEMLGVAQQHRLFPKLGGTCSATGLRRRIYRWSVFCDHGGISAAARLQFLGRGWSIIFALFHFMRALH